MSTVRLIFIALCAGAIITAGIGTLSQRTKAMQSLDYWTADWRSALLADRAPTQHEKVAVVLIDDDAIEGLPYRSPVDRRLLARLIDVVNEASADSIGLDFLFDQATEPAKDRELQAAIRRARARIVIGSVDDRVQISPIRRAYLQTFLETANARAGHVNMRYELDQVVRAEPDGFDAQGRTRSFAAALATIGASQPSAPLGRIAWLGAPLDNTDPILVIPAKPLLADASEQDQRLATLLRRQLQGRTVLIGGDLNGQGDRHTTPLSRISGEPMLGVMIHAHLVAQYLDGRRLIPIEPHLELGGIFALSAVGFLIGWTLYHTRLLTGIVPMLVLATLDATLFGLWRLTIPFASLALGWLIGVVLGRSLRWWRERTFRNRRTGAN